MFEQINSQFVNYGKQAFDAGFKAQQLALENFERVANLQLKALEERVLATLDFIGEASEVRDVEGAKTVWPKGVALAKENGERFYGVSQQALGQSLKAGEAIGALLKSQFEAANEAATETVAQASPAKRRAR